MKNVDTLTVKDAVLVPKPRRNVIDIAKIKTELQSERQMIESNSNFYRNHQIPTASFLSSNSPINLKRSKRIALDRNQCHHKHGMSSSITCDNTKNLSPVHFLPKIVLNRNERNLKIARSQNVSASRNQPATSANNSSKFHEIVNCNRNWDWKEVRVRQLVIAYNWSCTTQ